MLTSEEKRFFISIAVASKELSGCETKEGAVLIHGRRILSYGFNRRVVTTGSWEISAIYDTLFGSKDIDLSGTTLISTRFPRIDELKLIVAAGISRVYFFGNIDDADSVRLLNALPDNNVSIEIIKLET